MNYERVTADYLKWRDERAALKRTYEAEDQKILAKMQLAEGVLLAGLNNAKVRSMNSAYATFYIEEVVKPSASDWHAVYDWIKANDAFEMLEKRITKTFVTNFMAEHKDTEGNPMLPPGVQVFRENVVRVRRNKE